MTKPGDAPPTRNADRTRAKLMEAARLRFAAEGYRAATVKGIAEDAGVNASLVNRYFASKEGLFEACLADVERQMRSTFGGLTSIDDVAAMLAGTALHHTNGPTPSGGAALALLLRTSGDENADRIRIRLLERIVDAIAHAGQDNPTPDRFMGAHLLLCTALGLAVTKWGGLALGSLASAPTEVVVEAIKTLTYSLLGDGLARVPSAVQT